MLENAAKALDRLRLLEAEIHYYPRHSKRSVSLDPQKFNRLTPSGQATQPLGGLINGVTTH